eukprot:SAG11_NODE_23692_length_383_cov_1.119298_2_plen_34_part_01
MLGVRFCSVTDRLGLEGRTQQQKCMGEENGGLSE